MKTQRIRHRLFAMTVLGLLTAGCQSTDTGVAAPDDQGASVDAGTDGGSSCSPEGVFDGAPITANAGEWTWVDVPGAVCRSGSATGFGIRLNPASDKLVIYFQGGGACFNTTTCNSNAATFGASEFALARSLAGQRGLFNATDANNPFKDWNLIFVPYCTGDVHAGNATGVSVPGSGAPQNQQFVGYRNVGLFLKRIVPTFPSVTKVLVTGSSAGGFGSMLNYHRIAQAFCPRQVSLVNDSGPIFSDAYLAPCLQKRWRQLWNFDSSLPADCTDCSKPDGGGFFNFERYLARKYSNQRLGLISYTQDSTIAYFFGYGQNNCAGIDGNPGSVPAATFQAGLLELRDSYLKPDGTWSTFYPAGTNHTILLDTTYSTFSTGGTKLTDWMSGIVNQGSPSHIGP
ncbi:MAG: hypothetical protein JNM40_08340 [Myxococcales bacterium]|nr:hypothetical protein [Myxococcales bacterium]